MKRTALAIFIPVTMSLLLSVLHFPQAAAVCCFTKCHKCGDCETGTPYCGVGLCNIFGCDCDGGCRVGSCEYSRCPSPRKLFRGRRAALVEEDSIHKNVSQIIKSADRNLDGKLDLVEATDFLKLQKSTAHLEDIEIEKAFKELDKNGDQFLSSFEIDKF